MKNNRALFLFFEEKTKILVSYSVLYILILYGFFIYIVPMYGYMGFQWYPDKVKFIEGGILYLCLVAILPSQFNKPSDLFLHIQFVFPVVSMFVLYSASGYPRPYLYYTVMAYLLLFLVIRINYIKIKPINSIKLSSFFFQQLLLILSWTIIGLIILFGGLRYLNFDISKVYDFRTAASENLPGIFGYLSPFASKILLPFSLLIALRNKRKIITILSAAGSVMMFSLTAHKGPLLYPLLVLILFYILTYAHPINLFLYGNIVIVAISIISFLWSELNIIPSLLLRRSYLVPAFLNYIYYDFFSDQFFIFWSQSKLSFGLLDYPYNIDSSHLIGLNYFNNDANGANTGWIGSGYMNAGFFGMIVYAILIGLLLKIIDEYALLTDKQTVVAILVVPFLALAQSTDLPSAMLTHGFMLALIILSFYSTSKEN